MPKVVAQIPDDIYKNIDEEVKLGYSPAHQKLSMLR
jgi:hypothetical protein